MRDTAAHNRPLDRNAVDKGSRAFLLNVADIEWIESEGNHAQLHHEQKSHLVRRTLRSLERDLDAMRFLRISRSAIVNTGRLAFVERQEGEQHAFQLASGTRLVSARRYFAAVDAYLRDRR